MRALAYLEYCNAKHQLAAIFRSPGRLALWLPYLVVIAAMVLRFTVPLHVGSAHANATTRADEGWFATLTMAAYLGAFGMVIALAAAGRSIAFRSRGEALAFVNAGLSSRTVVMWLQLRKVVASSWKWIPLFLYVFTFGAPRALAWHPSSLAFLSLAGLASLSAIELPAFLLSRRRFGRLVAPAGEALLLFGAAYAILAGFGPKVLSRAVALTGVDPGRWLLALLAGGRPLFALVALVPVALAALPLVLGGDAIPELFLASQQAFAQRKQRRSRAVRFRESTPYAATRIPPGAFALLWHEWIAMRRRPAGLRSWLLGFVLCTGAGTAVAYDVVVLHDFAIASGVIVGTLMVALTLVLTTGVTIADDLAKPIWWLGRDPLIARIGVWTVARAWRGGTSFAMLPLVAGIGTGKPALALAGAFSALVVWWTLVALGVGLYAAFPSRIDESGPLVLLRAFGFAMLMLPALVAGLLVGVLTRLPALGVCAAAALLATEASAAIAFAAWRIAENGAGIAALERAA